MHSPPHQAQPLPAPAVYSGQLSYTQLWKQYQRDYYCDSTTNNNNTNTGSGGAKNGALLSSSSSSSSSTVIRDLAFCDDSATGQLHYLLACTEGGELCIWKLPPAVDDDNDDGDIDNDDGKEQLDATTAVPPSVTNKRPICRWQVTQGPLNSVQIMNETDDQQGTRYEFVIVAGQGGVWLYDWIKDIEPLLVLDNHNTNHNTNDASLQQQSMCSPISHFKLHPSPTKLPVAVNDTCLSQSFLYGAAQDAFGCYKWDLTTERLVATYTSGSATGSLQTVKTVPNSNLLLTGGGGGGGGNDGGLLGIWDTTKDQQVDQLDLAKHLAPLPPPQSTLRRKAESSSSIGYDITSIVTRDENWWMVAGGKSSAGKNMNGSGNTGFVSTWHGPTRSLVASTERRERPQKLAYSERYDTLLSVANESFVSQFDDPLTLATDPQRIRCDPVSAYAVEAAADGRVAVAGVGSAINIFQDGTLLTNTLRL